MTTGTTQKYLEQIDDAIQPDGIYAYRGQSQSRWPLYSAATRRLIREFGCRTLKDPDYWKLFLEYHRETLIEPARARGFGSDSGHQLTDLQLLAKLQQFGAATGLLDFTWSPLVALWFAVSADSNSDGRLFIVNTNDTIRVARVSSDEASQRVDAVFSRVSHPPHLSYWEPAANGDAATRILRQRSVFILGRPLLPADMDVVLTIEISQNDKEALRRELQILDVHEESLFSDVYGFAESSRRIPMRLPPEAYRRRGNYYYQQREYTSAVAAYTKALVQASDVGFAYLLRANAHAASGEHREAVRDYDQAIAEIDQIPAGIQDMAYFNRGNSKAELGRHADAVVDYTEAIKRARDAAPEYFYNRANAFLDLCRFEDAIHDYERASGVDDAVNKAIALVGTGRLAEAQDCYHRAVLQGADPDRLRQSQWTLEQIVSLLEGVEYDVTGGPDPTTGTLCLKFELKKRPSDVTGVPRTLLLTGRSGNAGNTGVPGLSGGGGYAGRPGILVYGLEIPQG